MEQIKYCANCEQKIEAGKYILHERFCAQNVKKCSICKIPINIDDEEDHINDFHLEIICEFCNKKYGKAQIDDHKKKCNEKMDECIYCTMQVSKRDKREHEIVCGAKTEQCSLCQYYISKKDMLIHLAAGCRPDEVPINKQISRIDDHREKKMKGRENYNGPIITSGSNNPFKNLSNKIGLESNASNIVTGNKRTPQKKFDMQLGPINNNNKINNEANDSLTMNSTNRSNANGGLGQHVSKPAFIKSTQGGLNNNIGNGSNKITTSNNVINKTIESKPPQITKMSSVKATQQFQTKNETIHQDIKKANTDKNKKKNKKQFLPLNQYNKDDEYQEVDDLPHNNINKMKNYSPLDYGLYSNDIEINETIKRSLQEK